MDDIIVETWNDFNDLVLAGSKNDGLGRVRSGFAYRGVANSHFDLKTSRMRLGGNYHALEGHIFRNFKKYAFRETVPENSTWNWLALAQHHGLPTRLLDWTYSPYVALHFVTEDVVTEREGEATVDGAIWCVDRQGVHDQLPETLKSLLTREKSNVFTAEALDQRAKILGELDQLATTEFVLFFEPPSFDERIVNQFALHSLMSHPGDRSGPWLTLDHWLEQYPGLCRRIIIPAKKKWEFRDMLDEINITERVLYPGLDGLSRWLKRYYMPRVERPMRT